MNAPAELHTVVPNRRQAIIYLAGLSLIDYDQRREALADVLGCRASSLDDEVTRHRPKSATQNSGQGRVFEIKKPDPWPDPVDGAALLDELSNMFKAHVALPKHAEVTLALWVMHTYALSAADCTPILALTSPEPRCGKTTLLGLLSKVVYRPLTTANASSAALFRVIEAQSPTLLVDEADSFLPDNEPLRGVLNSGHTRETAYVIRCDGDNHEPRRFSTWGAKAIACIGRLPRTIADRAILIRLCRKLPGDKVSRLRDVAPGVFQSLAAKCQRFADDSLERLTRARPAIPESLNDRAADSWEPLLAIGDAVGKMWPELTRQAAEAAVNADTDSESLGVKLLADIRDLFSSRSVDRISTDDLVRTLGRMEERPWGDLRGKPLTSRDVGRLLGLFGIQPGTIRLNDKRTAKGYNRDRFEDAFTRYLPPVSVTTSQPPKTSGSCGNLSVTFSHCVTD